jgi:PKD repeat protein
MAKSYLFRRALFAFVLSACAFSAFAQQFKSEIDTYLKEARFRWNLSEADISQYVVSDQYTDRRTGIVYTYLQQQVAGIRIFNAVSPMAIRDGKVIWFANRFHPDAAQHATGSTPLQSAESAIAAAAGHLGLSLTATPTLQKEEKSRHRYTFSDGGISKRPIRVDLEYVLIENTLHLAWDVNIAVRNSPDWWNVRIDAHTGAFLGKNNWNVSCSFDHDHAGGAACQSARTTVSEKASTSAAAGGYNVFALPLEAPNFGGRSLLTNPELALASPFGWHDTDGIAGPEFTITQGNNVHAYEDENDTDQPGYSPDGGAALNFDFPLDLTQSPQANRDAIITNLFYMNNVIHDILYRHGFTEETGNFQANNYGKGGVGDDYVLAEAQDGGGTNNANFATPDDGSSGRMQMYLWPSSAPALLNLSSPADIAGNYNAVEAAFGPDLTVPVSADLVLYQDDTAPATNACEPAINAFDIADKIVVIDRGTCSFIVKVQAAEAAGAAAAIIVNNSGTDPFTMTGNGAVSIPSVMISQADGNTIKAKLAAGEKVSGTLSKAGNAAPDRDGSLDNGIIIHEYGHGVSNRLTGGPSNSGCLFNDEQGGEGWSDWLALLLTIEPGDAGTDSRGIGTYALNDSSGVGIRRFPYSTDMAVNGQTYGDLTSDDGVHNIGEIWNQALWDMTWKLIDLEGFDPDWYAGNGGNHTALRLVLEGMRLQPCGPGFLDARDAILAADELLYNNAHRCLIWEAFAGRGMGFNANQGSAGTRGDETEDFSLPTFCQNAVVPPVANFTVDVETNCFGVFSFKDQSTDIPQSWLWDFGDGTTSTAINPTHTYTVPGVYTVNLTVTNTVGTDDYSLTVNYTSLPNPVVVSDTSVCTGGSIILTAGVDAGNTATWSTGGQVVYTGTTFTTPAISAPVTYSVQQIEDKPVGHVGPADNTIGGGGNHNTGFEGKLLFEALAPFTLVSVQVYAQGAGERTVRLYNAANAVIQTVTVQVPAGASRITLNLDIPAAGLYSIGNVSENLYRNNSGANYPYELANIVRIYSSNATSSELDFYYYFYDWEVKEKACASLPVAVNVGVTSGPVAGFTASGNASTVTFTNTTTGAATGWSWNFGDGSPLSNAQNPVHTYAAPGQYTVVLTASSGDCSTSFQQTVTVGSSSINNPEEPFAFRVYPNPADQNLQVEIERALSGQVNVEMTDATGRIVLSDRFAPASSAISLRIGELAAGVYSVRVTGREGSAVRKVTVIR